MNAMPDAEISDTPVGRIFGKPTPMPSEEDVPDFAATMREYQDEMFKLSKRLLSYMARVLGQAPDFFEQFLTKPVATQRLLHYWPLQDFWRQIGVGMHTDYGLLAILLQDTVGGLQVLNAKDLYWVHAVPIPGAFVVNFGDMLTRWTGHQFKATVHRVVTISASERYSIPYFLEPNLDTILVPGGIASKIPPGLDAPKDEQPPSEHVRRCRLRAWWAQMRDTAPEPRTAGEILLGFYKKAGMIKDENL